MYLLAAAIIIADSYIVAYLIKNDNGVRRSHIFYSKSTLTQEPPQQSCCRRRAHDSARGADRISNEHLYQKCAEAKCAL